MSNYQRKGAESNTKVGHEFEVIIREYFQRQGVNLESKFKLPIGICGKKRIHSFDLGDGIHKVIVECKSHTWTETWNVPSAKMMSWNQAMLFFMAAPDDYKKILFVLKHFNPKRGLTLAEYYIRSYLHLIPKGVEVWEYDESSKTARKLEIPSY